MYAFLNRFAREYFEKSPNFFCRFEEEKEPPSKKIKVCINYFKFLNILLNLEFLLGQIFEDKYFNYFKF